MEEDGGGVAVLSVPLLKETIEVPFTPNGEHPTKLGALALTPEQVWISNSIASVTMSIRYLV